MDTSLQLPLIASLDSAQSARLQTLATPRERDASSSVPERQTPESPSVRVDISPAAQIAARVDTSLPRPTSAGPAVPVQPRDAVVRADRSDGAESTPTAASQQALRRYLENAGSDNRPAGQSGPSTVRISA
ncbi:MAG: hypothetical protein LBT71_09015 [Azoarcus sp.]|jgi:hypothetical protein|nr:hypothetical protein [Azoarcus sp.]